MACRRAPNSPSSLQAALKGAGIDAVVENAGVSGDTSAGGLSRLDWSLADHPDAAILELGSNDMLRGIAAGRDGKEFARHSGDAETDACRRCC